MTAHLTPDELLATARTRSEAGDLRIADNYVAMVLEKYPDRADAWALAAHIAFKADQTEECQSRIARSLERQQDQPLARALRGTLRQAARDWIGASEDYEAALPYMPDDASLLNALAACLRMLGRFDTSLALCLRAIELAPDFVEARHMLGVVAQEMGDHALAEKAYREVLARRETLAMTHNNLATLLQARGQATEAEAHYRRAVELDPAYAVAWKNLAALYQVSHAWEAALAAYDRAGKLDATLSEAHAGGLYMALQMAQWDGLTARCEALLVSLERDPQARVPPFAFLPLDDNPERQREVSRRWARSFPAVGRTFIKKPQEQRIRLGYVGGDFFAHATTWLTAGLFKGHDRSRFEVFGYDYGINDQSDIRQSVIGDFDQFTHVADLGARQIAERIQTDGIDILIDLKGWTRDTRAELMAYRPAPLQVHYLAYPGTLGAAYCDYLIADPVVAPPGSDTWFDEALVRLPHSYQINDNAREVRPAPDRHALGLPESALVLVCFNQHYKINPLVFDVWMQVLREIPDAVLWLMQGQDSARKNLYLEAARRGIAPARLVFAPPMIQAEHIARLGAADLALDTYPFSSHTTASDALWAGVPLVAVRGNSFCSRVSASCLHAIGMPEMVADSLAEYAALVLRLCRDRDYLRAQRAKLAANRTTMPLFDTAASIRALERAYERMWACCQAGRPPASIDLSNL